MHDAFPIVRALQQRHVETVVGFARAHRAAILLKPMAVPTTQGVLLSFTTPKDKDCPEAAKPKTNRRKYNQGSGKGGQ